MPSNWTKQPQFLTNKYFNGGSGDATVGGSLMGGIGTQGDQTLPGDRIILGAADALAMSNTTVGTLYGGLYQYVRTANSTSTPTIGHGAFWDLSVADSQYRVTSDEPANITTTLPAGFFINTLTKTYSWWILVAGKVNAKFAATLTGTGAIGAGAYWLGGGNNNSAADVGALDVLAGANIGGGANAANFYGSVDTILGKYVGVCETAASNNNMSLVDVRLPVARY